LTGLAGWPVGPECAKIRKMIDGLIRYLKQHQNHNRQTGLTG
jgi:hypothetical protein